MTPTARTLALLRKDGYLAAVVERRVPTQKFITQDLFGCIDILAVGNGDIVGIQCTSGANHATRRTKASLEPRLATWLKNGGRFAIVSWAKQGERGKRKLWTHRWEWVDYVQPAEVNE